MWWRSISWRRRGRPVLIAAVLAGSALPSLPRTAEAITDAPLSAFGHDLSASVVVASDALLVNFYDADQTGTAADFTATIDWGDGSPTQPGAVFTFNPTPPQFLVRGSHTYPTSGSYVVTVSIVDRGGARATTSADAFIGRSRRLAATGSADGAMWVRGSPRDGGWSGLGGVVTGAAAVVALPGPLGSPVPLYVVVGTDGALWATGDNLSWYHLSTAFTDCVDTPAATVVSTTGGDRLVVACEGADHGVWISSVRLPQQGLPVMGAFGPLGQVLQSGPAMMPDGLGGVELLVNEADGVHAWTAATGFRSTTWTCTGRPALALAGDLAAYFACRGTDNALWVASRLGRGAWSAAHSEGGQLAGPAAISAFQGDALVSVQGTDGGVWELTVSRNLVATGFHPLGGSIVNGVGSAAMTG